ncbi:hypothetical protein BC629DRAFT_1589180 [Irpex lacteus]|nr:hypothetical protein BC629DRAFT_1589180 [Irpex lacteus]
MKLTLPFDSTPSFFDNQFFVESLLKGTAFTDNGQGGEVTSPIPGEFCLQSDFVTPGPLANGDRSLPTTPTWYPSSRPSWPSLRVCWGHAEYKRHNEQAK